jgi:hypothetical protein
VKARTIFLIAAFALFLALTSAGLWYLQTENFQEFIRTSLISRIENDTGLDCRIGRIELDVYRGTLQVEDVRLEAQNEVPGFAFLQIDEIRARFSLSSLWNFRMRLGELHLIHPQVKVLTGPGGEDSGWNPDGFLNTLKISLRLETRKFTVQEGRVTINEHSASFNLDLEDLDCRIGYDGTLPSYKISLDYKQSRLLYKEREIIHDLKLTANLSINGFAIETIEFRHDESLLSGSGSVENWDSPALALDMAGVVSAGDLVLADSSLNEGWGKIDVNTRVRFDGDGIYLKGDFLARNGAYRKMDYADLAGAYEILHDVLYLRDVTGKIVEGDITAEGEIQLRNENNKPNRLIVHTERVPLSEVGDLLNVSSIQYGNTVDSRTELTWGHGWKVAMDCEAVLHGLEGSAQQGLKSTPLGGNARFSYHDGETNLSYVDLRSSDTSINAYGGADALFHVRLSTSRFSEPLDLLANFSPAVAGLIDSYPDLSALDGTYDFSGDVRIRSSSDIEYEGSMSVKKGKWRSLEVDVLDTAVHLEGPHLAFRNLSVSRGLQAVQGDLSLDFANEEDIASFDFHGNFQRIPLPLLKDSGLSVLDMTGVLNGSGRIHYEQSTWNGSGLLSVEKGSFKGQSFDRLIADIAVEKQHIRFKNMDIARGEATIQVEGQIDTDTGQLNLTTNLQHLPLSEIPALTKNESSLQGYANASGAVNGTLESPAFDGAFELENLRYKEWDLGRGQGELKFEEGVVEGSANIHSDLGFFSLQSQVALIGEYPGTIILNFDNLNLRKIVSDKTPPYLKEISTAMKGRIEGEGSFGDWTTLKLRGQVDGAQFKIQDYELRNNGQIQLSIAEKILSIDVARIQGVGTDLLLKGSLPLDDRPTLKMDLEGSLDLEVLAGIREKLDVSGNAEVNIRATGSKQDPLVIGRVTLNDARLEYEGVPFPVSYIQGDIVLSQNVARFENIHGRAASGLIELSGAYEHTEGVMRSINLEIAVEQARLPYPKDFRSTVDAKLRLSGDSDLQILSGDIDVIRTEYVRDFNLLEQLARGRGTQSGLLAQEPGLQNLRLNIDIRSNNGLVIDNELARVNGSFRLTLRGTPAYPSLTGRAEAGDGTIFFRGNRFVISHAYADFIDRNRINPVLDIRAEADVKTYRLILDATGTLDNFSLNITSDPPMSTVDILSLLTTGMTDTGSPNAQRESQMAGLSAASVLSENLTGVIGKRVQRIFGLESFRVDPFLEGAENNPTARITISERISPELVVTFSRNLSTNEEQVVVIEYDVGKDLSVIGTRDEDGKFGIDFRLRKRF